MNPIAVRLLSQQLACRQYSLPHDVVAHMGAVQAQDYRMMRWAVMMRMRHPSAEAFRKAFDGGDIVRLHLLRGTWQLVSADDYWWMLSLCAGRAERVLRGWMKANGVAIDDYESLSIREILIAACHSLGSATKEDFAEAVSLHGMAMDAHRLSYHIRLAELHGVLCSGSLTPMRATYALAEHKVRRREEMSRDAMLTLLCRKYFQSHSPATFEDFVWWTGVSAADCRRAVSLLGNELREIDWHGYHLYLHASCRTSGFRSGILHLLPPFDEYLIGYKSRELCLAPEHTRHAHTNNGIFFPVIARDGIVCGNWSPWEKKLNVSFFNPDGEPLSLERQWREFERVMK